MILPKTYKLLIVVNNRMFPGDLTGSPDGLFLSPLYALTKECKVSTFSLRGISWEKH